MLPSIEEALYELKTAGQMNPGPWIKHSYILMKDEFKFEPQSLEEIEIKNYISNCVVCNRRGQGGKGNVRMLRM